jgi:hypothetical protein
MDSPFVSAAPSAAASLPVPATSLSDAGTALVAVANSLLADLERGQTIDVQRLRRR